MRIVTLRQAPRSWRLAEVDSLRMTALRQKPPVAHRITMPAFHSEAAIARQIGYVRKVQGDLVLTVGSAQTHAPKL
jgi:hypothetical protein